jgi:hypothetical protein
MRALTAAFFAAHGELSLGALGLGANEPEIDLAPFGHPARYFAAERHAGLIERFQAADQLAFPDLPLPGWVLSDLYLMPGAIGLLLGPARALPGEMRARLGLHPDDEAVAAAYVALPNVTPGLFIGAALFSLIPGIQAGAWVKALTLKMLGATRLRGVAQWGNPSVRVHCRLGPLRLVGPVPGAHELGARSFVYESDLGDPARIREAMKRQLELTPTRRIRCDDLPALTALLDRAAAGEMIEIVPPGLDASGEILIREAPGEDRRL